MKGGRSLETLSWREFELMLAGAFREQGYLVADNPPGPDDGIDLRLRKDGEIFYVQAKHWRHKPVGVSVVRELHGVVTAGGVDCGILVASGGFTPDAKAFAKKAGVRLVGPGELRRWFAGKAPQESPEPVPLGPAVATSQPPICPVCSVQMAQRVARRGANAGQSFWGCTNFPSCRQTQPIE
jgi:restriction system protein